MPKRRSKHRKHINNELKQQKHKNIKTQKEVISKPNFIHMHPN